MNSLTNRVAFVTGPASGMGRATALAMVREVARVLAADVDQSGLAWRSRPQRTRCMSLCSMSVMIAMFAQPLIKRCNASARFMFFAMSLGSWSPLHSWK
jgi:NAD(P)-dependent dehydrogenase (short-subunit alcohol dehydrogenase family)